MSTYEEFVTEYTQGAGQAKSNGLRQGQWFYNLLSARHPHLAGVIRGTRRDPFYHDKVRPVLWEFTCENWNIFNDTTDTKE